MDETRIVGDLPNVRIELTYRAEPDGSAEYMTINLTATPDFRSTLPLFGQMAAWQAMMAPWLALARANPFPAALPPPFDGRTKK